MACPAITLEARQRERPLIGVGYTLKRVADALRPEAIQPREVGLGELVAAEVPAEDTGRREVVNVGEARRRAPEARDSEADPHRDDAAVPGGVAVEHRSPAGGDQDHRGHRSASSSPARAVSPSTVSRAMRAAAQRSTTAS